MIAFVVCFIAAFLILVLLSGFAQHMGNPDHPDWVTIVVVSLLAGLVGSALWGGLVEVTQIVSGVLS